MSVKCAFGHVVEGVDSIGSLYCYSDPKNGIPNDIVICKECLFDHVHFYYPGCGIEQNLLDLYPELESRLPVSKTETIQQLDLFE